MIQITDIEAEQKVRGSSVPVQLSYAVNEFIRHCEDSGLARSTWKNYKIHLDRFTTFANDSDVTAWREDDALELVTTYLEWVVCERQLKSFKKDRLTLSAFFNFLRKKRWYKGANPAEAKLHEIRKPREGFKPKRRTTPEEDYILRKQGSRVRLWPIILLTRWAGLRRGEACVLKWKEIFLEGGHLDVIGHEGGRKHPRRVWIAPWVALQLRGIKPTWLPDDGEWPLWPHHPDTATDDLLEFCTTHLKRSISFNDLRASFVSDCFACGLTPKQESKIVGHSAKVAEEFYDEYDARDARMKLPSDPLTCRGAVASDAEFDAKSGAIAP